MTPPLHLPARMCEQAGSLPAVYLSPRRPVDKETGLDEYGCMTRVDRRGP